MSEGNILELPRSDRPAGLSEDEWGLVQAVRADGSMAGEFGYSPAKAAYMPELLDAAIAALEPFAQAFEKIRSLGKLGDDVLHFEIGKAFVVDRWKTLEQLRASWSALKLLQPDQPAEEWQQDPPGMDLFAEALICEAFARFNLQPFDDRNPNGLAGLGWRHNVWALVAALMSALDAARAAADCPETPIPVSEHSVVAARLEHAAGGETRAHLVIAQDGRDMPSMPRGRKVIVRGGRFGLPQILQGRVLRCEDADETASLLLLVDVSEDPAPATLAPGREVAS